MGFLAGGNRKVLQPAGDRFPIEREQETGVVVGGNRRNPPTSWRCRI